MRRWKWFAGKRHSLYAETSSAHEVANAAANRSRKGTNRKSTGRQPARPSIKFFKPTGMILEERIALAAASTTAVTSSLDPSTFGQSVALTATMAAASGTHGPSGSITFDDGSTYLGSVSIAPQNPAWNGVANLPIPRYVFASTEGSDGRIYVAQRPRAIQHC